MTASKITIREYALITTANVQQSLDLAQVSTVAFDWLCELSFKFKENGATLLQIDNKYGLRWDSYVGVLELPCGTQLEILPKHHTENDCVDKSRDLLKKLIKNALHLKTRDSGVASNQLFDVPLNEWVIGQFLSELDLLVKCGLRFSYQRIEEEQRYLRGQLNVVSQMRQPPGRDHCFHIRHDLFSPDRPENRLLKLVVEKIAKATGNPDNWRLSNELRSILGEIKASNHITRDLQHWSNERLMSHYRSVKPWCELILNQQMPFAVSGDWRGVSMLFPMEKLFETYVESWLRNRLKSGSQLESQNDKKSLCTHQNQSVFKLRPDLLLKKEQFSWVLDTKWKLLNSSEISKNYGLSQSDFYQLFAYGQIYLGGQGELALIYPKNAYFQRPLPVFKFNSEMKLWVLPFDLEEDKLLTCDDVEFTDCLTDVH